MTWLFAAGAELIGLLVSGAKWLANLRYLYKTSPEEVQKDKIDTHGKITEDRIDSRKATMLERIAARRDKWKKRRG